MQKNELSRVPWPGKSSTLKICRVELCTELFNAIIPTLFLCFLLICYPYIHLFLSFLFFLFYVLKKYICQPAIQESNNLMTPYVLKEKKTIPYILFLILVHVTSFQQQMHA